VPGYSGKFQYPTTSGQVLSEGACKVSFDAEKFTLVPASGPAIAFDLADVDKIRPAEWELALDLYSEKRVLLRQFGAAFGGMSAEFVKAWRYRTLAALLLEDLEEIARYDAGTPDPAEVRIFKSNIAVLPKAATPFRWRLAEVDSIEFDDAAYAFHLARGNERLTVSKLAKKTGEFGAKLREAFDALRQHTVEALRDRFPALDPDSLATFADFMREGRSVAMGNLAEIDPRLPDAIVDRAVSASLRPYFDWLRERAGQDRVMTGFKFVRPDGEDSAEEPAGEQSGEEDQGSEEDKDLFFWFFFPIPGANMVAWEATTGSGRATYFFRLAPGADVEESIQRLTRALALISFRREPVYLPDRSLEEQPRFHKYAIAARKISEVRTLRAAYAGRAIHSSLEPWQSQAETILNGSQR
jgi:hypothetical protein